MKIGPYEVVRELGRGGMGVVYEARHPEVARPLALKLVDASLAEGEGLARFGREAQLLARVRHPNVLGVHTLGRTDDGHPYLVTDLVEGRPLHAVRRDGPLPERRVAEILRDLCRGLEAVHAAGILHRDLKAENVLLRPDGAPVLLDFGLAREVGGEAMTKTGVVLGTPGCMAPEQAAGDSPSTFDARVDVYGLGAILFQLLAGRPPFEGASLPQLLFAVMEREPSWASLSQGTPGLSEALVAICRKALAKSREARYHTAAELREDLERWLRGERPVALAARRGRAPIVLGAGAAVALAVAGAWVASRPPPAVPPPAPASSPPPPVSRAPPRLAPPAPPSVARYLSAPPREPSRALLEHPLGSVTLPGHVRAVFASATAVHALAGDTSRHTVALDAEPLAAKLATGDPAEGIVADVAAGVVYLATVTETDVGLACVGTRRASREAVVRRQKKLAPRLALSADGGTLAVASGGDVLLVRTADLETITRREVHELAAVNTLVFSADGRRLLLGGTRDAAGRGDRGGGTVLALDVRQPEAKLDLVAAAGDGPIQALARHPSLPLYAIGTTASTIHVYDDARHGTVGVLDDGAKGQLVRSHPVNHIVHVLAFSPDGRWLYSGARQDGKGDERGSLRAWRFQADGRGSLHRSLPGGSEVLSLDVDPTGRLLAAGSKDGLLAFHAVGEVP